MTGNTETPADENGGIKKRTLALGFLAMPLPVKVVLILVLPALAIFGGFMVAIAVAALPALWPLVLILCAHVTLVVIAAVKKHPRHTTGDTFARLGRGMKRSPVATGVAFGLGVVAAGVVHLQTGGGIPSGAGGWIYLTSTLVGIAALAVVALAVVQHARGAVEEPTPEPTEAPAEDLPRIEEA